MLEYVKLTNVGPADDLQFDFANRLNVITGDNGLGKSFILDVAWWALTRTWAGDAAMPRRKGDGTLAKNPQPTIEYKIVGVTETVSPTISRYDFGKDPEKAWHLGPGKKPMPGVVIYARVDGSFSVWDPSRNYYRDDREGLLSFQFSKESVWSGLRLNDDKGQSKIICRGLIEDWGIWESRDKKTFDKFTSVLRALSPRGAGSEALVPGPSVRLRADESLDIPTLKTPYGQVPITQASAGIKRVLALAYLIVWAWYEHLVASGMRRYLPAKSIVLLIDEVEAHLHPQWQRLILPAVYEAVKALVQDVNVQVVAVTHSPLVLASVEPDFSEELDALFKFNLREGKVEAEKMRWSKQGDAVNWLVSEVFDMKQARSWQAERAIDAAMAFMRGDEASLPEDLSDKEAIHRELCRVLADHDEFWAQWIVSIKNGEDS